MTISNTTSNSLASLLSSTLNSVNSANGTGGSSTSITGSPISTGPIDVNTLVSELMTVESQPLRQLQSQQSGVQAKLSAYGQLQSSLSSFDTAVSALKLNSAFTASQATVTGSGVSAAVTGAPAAGTYSVSVSSIAQAQSAASAPFASAATVVGTGTLAIQVGSNAAVNVTIDSTNNTLGGIAAAINGAAAGVNATVVTDNSGSRLVLTAANSGTANTFKLTVTDSDGNNTDMAGLSQIAFDTAAPAGAGQNLSQTQVAADAHYSINGLNLTSSTNSITTAINGLTLNLTQAPPSGSTLQAQITVGSDTSAVTDNVNNFVKAYNSLVGLGASLTAYNQSTNAAAPLTGDAAMFSLSSQLRSILGSQVAGVSGPSWLADVGIDFQKDGTLSLNSTKFSSALAANPSGVAKLFSNATGTGSQQGFAVQLASSVDTMLSPTGLLGGTQTSLQSTISSMDNRIGQMQTQLNQTQQQLIQQYSKLNSDMVMAQQQQVALANALAGLPPP